VLAARARWHERHHTTPALHRAELPGVETIRGCVGMSKLFIEAARSLTARSMID